jgi:small-conductance mechanosensitive channel
MDEILATVKTFWEAKAFNSPSGPVAVNQLVLALAVAAIGIFVARLITKTVSRRLNKTQMQRDATQAIERVFFYLLIVIVVVTALGLLGIPLTAFAFVSGAAAIGVGFGAQNIFNNFISGWILMSERPVRIGDVIEIDGSFGVVEEIGGRSTRIRRVDGVHMLVPNSTMLETTLVNWTLVDRNIRTSITVGVAYGSPVKKIRELLLEAVHDQKEALHDPPPQIIFDDFGDSALIFVIYFWTNVGTEKEMRQIRSEIRFRITELFEQNGITIPFPQRDVHLIQPAAAKAKASDGRV